MKFLKTRVLPLFLVCVLSVSLLVVPASATASFPNEMVDDFSVAEWEAQISGNGSALIDSVANILGCPAGVATVFWTFVNGRLQHSVGSVSRGELDALCKSFNEAFNTPMCEYFTLQVAQGLAHEFTTTLAQATLGTFTPSFSVAYDGEYECLRIIENHTGIWVVNLAGQYPYVTEDDASKEDQWLPLSNHNAYDIVDQSVLVTLRINYGGTIITKGNFKFLAKSGGNDLTGAIVLCSPEGRPYASWVDPNQTAADQDRNDKEVVVNGENVEVIEGNKTNLDLSGMTMVLPDGTFQFIDKVIYDESTKSYHIDSHDTYNTYITNNYTWNYYINYTSITYIGQTEEYNKYYEVYYELPDGRSSADLTKEDLEQLNLSVDVIPYGRSADDTSLRSLYHFDGDTKDSSYWNYCTDFTWNKGASLTYMDAGVFDGALYLDETEHDFTLTLPNNLSSNDFTLQFRYYQSSTLAPVTDSYLKLGSNIVLQMSGGYFSNSSGTQLSVTPVGTWNEIALIREDGTLYFYLNGVCIGSETNTTAFDDIITFHFGSGQQTFKYFDELRVLNYALQSGGANYECTSVPHDTNLALVLPDSAVPVADEYWSFTSSKEPLWSAEFTSGYTELFNKTSATTNDRYLGGNVISGLFTYHEKFSSPNIALGYATFNCTSVGNEYYYGYRFPIHYANGGYFDFLGNQTSIDEINSKHYVFSIVDADGVVYSFPFASQWVYDNGGTQLIDSIQFDWGSIRYIGSGRGCMTTYMQILPNAGEDFNFIYAEIVEAPETDLTVEWVESVTIFDREDLNTPTLAVRTDLDITSYQIGGVRPSIPEKGQVWAMVENDRIVSIQIYNGQAWEGVDGRIWTGQRWIPASSYNIITLQDMYDIVDATPNYEYIYSEAGFWAWWQKSWNAFQEKLFQALGSGGSGGGSIVPGTVKQKVSEALASLIEGIFGTITEVLKSLIGAAQDLLSGIFSFFSDTVFGGIRDFFSSFDELINPFETTIENEDGSTTTAPGLPDDVVTGLGFFSGLIMLIPDEVRVVLFFFAGLTLFIAILKRFA